MVFSSSSEESSSSPSNKKQNLPPAPKAPAPGPKKKSFLDSSSEDSSSSRPAKRPPTTATAPPPKSKALESSDSSSSSPWGAKKAPAPAPPPPPAAAAAKTKSDSSGSSSSSPWGAKKSAPAAPAPPPAKTKDSGSDLEEKKKTEDDDKKGEGQGGGNDKEKGKEGGDKENNEAKAGDNATPASTTDSPTKAEGNATTNEAKAEDNAANNAAPTATTEAAGDSPESATKPQPPPPPTPGPKPILPRTSSTGGSLDSSVHSSNLSKSNRSQLSPNSVMQTDLQKPADEAAGTTTAAAQVPVASTAAQVPVAPETPQGLQGNSNEEEKQEIASITGEPAQPAAPQPAQQMQSSSVPPPQPMQLSESPIQQQSSSSTTAPPLPAPQHNESYDVEDLAAQGHPVITTDNLHGAISEDSELTLGTTAYGNRRSSTGNVVGRGESHGIAYEIIEEEIIENDNDDSPYTTNRNTNNDEEEIIQQEVRFANPVVVTDLLEYRQDFDSPLSVNVAHHVPPEHDPNFVPWHGQSYQEWPWYEQPDLHVEGLTALCKRVLLASEDNESSLQRLAERGVRVEAHVINFANKLKNKRAQRLQQQQWQEEQHQSWEIPPPPPPPQVPMTKLTPAKSTSSFVSGPESVISSSSSSDNNRDPRTRQSRQQTFQSQQRNSGMQNIPSQAEARLGNARGQSQEGPSFMGSSRVTHNSSRDQSNISIRQRWSFVDAGAIPKRWNSIQQQMNRSYKQQQSQKRQRRQRQSPATHATQTLPLHQTFIPEHGVLGTHREESSSSSSEVDPRPIYARVKNPYMSRSATPSGKKNSRSSSLVNLDGEDSTNSVHSVPFDEEEPYAREFFQDELYYETVKKQGKRAKPRKVSSSTRSRDPPPAVAGSTSKQRKQPDPLNQNPWETPMRQSMISNVLIPDTTQLNRNMSNLSEISDGEFGRDNKRHPQTIGRSMWDPPTHLKVQILNAEKQQEQMNKNSTSIPDFAKVDIEELKQQWKAYVAKNTPANSQETIYMDDHLLSESSRDRRRARRKERSGPMGASNHSHGSSASSGGRLSLTEDERQRLQYTRVESGDAATDDMTPMHHTMAHMHDDEEEFKEELTFLGRIWANMGGISICLLLLVVWIIVLVASFTDIGAPSFSTVTTPPPTVEPATAPPGTAPTLAPDTSQLDGEELLPAWSWDVIQRDGNSPQWKAWEWLQESDTAGYSDERLIQRFAIATFYFATSADYSTGGETVALGGNSTEAETDTDSVEDEGWLDPDTSECTWNGGITCNMDEEVNSFTFSNQNLQGTLPNELGLLSDLLSLDLGVNPNLQGTLPTQLGLLTILLGLSLQNCDLTGSIPSELGLLTNVMWLNLATQGGSGDFSTARNTGNRKLSSTIPTELALLTNLEHLRLDDNHLTGTVTPLLSNMESLLTLVLSRNLLTGSLPVELSRLVGLEGLAVDSCQLTGDIPDEFSRMSSLKELHVYNNMMRGPLRASLGGLSDSLNLLALSANDFFGPLPVAWQSLSNLQLLLLDGNSEVTGTIPVEWGAQWPELQQIMLQGTGLVGEVPVGLCFLKEDPNEYSLETIGISCDRLTCTCGCTCL